MVDAATVPVEPSPLALSDDRSRLSATFMKDPRCDTLAEVLVGHSTRLESGQHLLIEAQDVPDEIVVSLIEAARRRGEQQRTRCGARARGL